MPGAHYRLQPPFRYAAIDARLRFMPLIAAAAIFDATPRAAASA